VVRGRRPGNGPGGDSLPTTAYLMEGERCPRDCGFCAQARTAVSRDDLLSRVNWPAVEGESFWEGLGRAAAGGRIRRACFQLTADPGALEALERDVTELHRHAPDLPVCVSAYARTVDEIERILGWGVERVTLAVDAVTPGLYREVKGGSLERHLDFLERAARRFPGRIGTHLIAGLGETEEEMCSLFQLSADLGVTAGLFAFTPVPGTRLESRPAPDVRSYRRLQAARCLIAGGHARLENMGFDTDGRIAFYGLDWAAAAGILVKEEAFRTSGCPDCNRPYYNERPSGVLYNYPRVLTPEETATVLEEARPVARSSAGGAAPSGGSAGAGATPDRSAERNRGSGSGPWRLIIDDEPRTGAENMAVDEALMLAHAAGETPPTLRFYRWDPPAVSLGYFQDPRTEVDRDTCRRAGVDIVRRRTGGRAVLHEHETTYSVVVSTGLLPGSVLETYRHLAAGLVQGLRRLGYEAELAPEKSTPGGAGNPDGACFEVPSSYEIVVGGKKVVGSAQVRRKGVILQHGSILQRLEPERLARVLGLPPEAAARIAAKAAGLDELRRGASPSGAVSARCRTADSDDGCADRARGDAPGYDEICRAVTRGLEAALGVAFAPSRLEPGEEALARRLLQEKYGLDSWNLKMPEKTFEAEREDA